MATAKQMLLSDVTKSLARFSSELEFEQIPAEVVERIKLSILDSIGVCMHGSTLPWTRMIADMIEEEHAGPVASILGSGRKTSIAGAVLVNSTAGHAFELDDIHKESIIHPGSLTVPVALAFAEANAKVNGEEVIAAVIAGYEVGTRVGNAATVRLLLNGWHPQGTTGTFAAAATAAHMLGLDAERTLHTFGIVGSQAGGLMASQEGAMVKRLHSGRAAQSGVYAAELASRGFTGITDVLEAPYGGYLVTHSDKPSPEKATAGLGTIWETLNVGYKAYAAVTSIHTALDALATIMREHNLKACDIAEIDVALSEATYVHCAWTYKAQGVTAAQMNLYYGLAMIALDGAAFVEQYREERLSDPLVFEFIKRIHAHIDSEIDAMGASFRHASRVTVKSHDGRTCRCEILSRRGSAENPLHRNEIIKKFLQLTSSCMEPSNAERVIDLVDSMKKSGNVEKLIRIVTAPIKS